MKNPELIIFTGDIQTGKTTCLMEWSVGRDDVAGILTPVTDNGRQFYSISEKLFFPMEACLDEKEILSVGRYVFSRKNFHKASDHLSAWISQTQWKYIILDELGPLELAQRSGFWDFFNIMINLKNEKINIVVVRKSILDQLCQLLDSKIISYQVKEKEELLAYLHS